KGGRLTGPAELKLGAASAVDPDFALVIAPGAAFDALGAASLANKTHPPARIRRAAVSVHVLRSAIDRRRGFASGARTADCNFKFRAAAPIDPDSPPVIAPGAALNALALATLADEANPGARIGKAGVTVHIIRGAVHGRSVVLSVPVGVPVAALASESRGG